MNKREIEKLKFPIGKIKIPQSITLKDIVRMLNEADEAIKAFIQYSGKLKKKDLNKSYRPGGRTASQVVHHLADCHINLYVRIKLALTEENPTIKPFDEEKWAMLGDSKSDEIKPSLLILDSINKRIMLLASSLKQSEFEKSCYHPESKRIYLIKELLWLYSWHSRHHLEHIKIILNS